MRFRAVLCTAAVVSIAVVVGMLKPAVSEVEQSLRTDLLISRSHSLSLIDVTTYPSRGGWGRGQQAVFVTSGGTKHRLASAYRHKNARHGGWRIGEVSVMYTDGHDEWEIFEQTFDHFPTDQEIKTFRDWIDGW